MRRSLRIVGAGRWLASRKMRVSPVAFGQDGDIGRVDIMLVDDKGWTISSLIVITTDWWLDHQVHLASRSISDSLARRNGLGRSQPRSGPACAGVWRAQPAQRDNRRDGASTMTHEGNIMKSILNGRFPANALRRTGFAASRTAALSLGLASTGMAATPKGAAAQPGAPTNASAAIHAKNTDKCRSDLQVLDTQMQKDGYWMRGASYGYGYGYPMGDYNYGVHNAAVQGVDHPLAETSYGRARPGYEVRTLLASAHILAQGGQQQVCEAVLGVARAAYTRYAADMHNGKVPHADTARWRTEQLAAAQPISSDTAYRSDQLIGTGVLTPTGVALGSVDDLVLDQHTGKIAYLVIGRGGFLGIGEKYVPVPWSDFKATAGTNLLVLDTTKDGMGKAPRVKEDQFATQDEFAQERQKVDAYWKGQFAK